MLRCGLRKMCCVTSHLPAQSSIRRASHNLMPCLATCFLTRLQENNLLDPKDKRKVLCNETLKSLFGVRHYRLDSMDAWLQIGPCLLGRRAGVMQRRQKQWQGAVVFFQDHALQRDWPWEAVLTCLGPAARCCCGLCRLTPSTHSGASRSY